MVHVDAKVAEENGRIVVHAPAGGDYEALSEAEKAQVMEVVDSINSGDFAKEIVERALDQGVVCISVPTEGEE